MAVDQDEIHRLALSENVRDREEAIKLLSDNFESLPDKPSAWFDLIRITGDKDSDVRWNASYALISAVSHVPDKPIAWSDLIRLTDIDDLDTIHNVTLALESAFPLLSDKSTAWFDLIRLTNSKDSVVRHLITQTIGSIFPNIPNQFRNETFETIHKLIEDDHPFVRFSASYSLAVSFRFLPDELKVQAWNDLYVLTDDISSDNRWCASDALSFSFQYIPDEFKLQAWAIIQELLNDKDWNVRQGAFSYISSIFMAAPEESKTEVWGELYRLTQDENNEIRLAASHELSYVFPFISDDPKSKIKACLHELSKDKDSGVRAYANHSIGKICIYKASKLENIIACRNLLKKAIRYFENAVNEQAYTNPATFCYLFYRSFDAVIFKKSSSKEEIDAYIVAAREEARGSESKQKLIEAVECLAEVLETAQNAKEGGNEYQELLEYCSSICNHVDQLMYDKRHEMPAIFGLYKNIRPSFGKTIKGLIEVVKEKAEVACKEARGTAAESIACSVNNEVQDWEVESQEQMGKNLDKLIFLLKTKVPDIPKNKSIIGKIDEIKAESKVEDQMLAVATLISLLPSMSLHEDVSEIKAEINKINENIDQLIVSIKEMQILKSGIKEEIQVTVGISGFGSGVQKVITIPVQEISYSDLEEDLQKYSNKLHDIGNLPEKLKDKIMGYIRKNEDKLEDVVQS